MAYNAEQSVPGRGDAGGAARMPWLYPDFVDEEDRMRLSIHALLVEAPGLRLVVDTCVGNDKAAPASSARSRSRPTSCSDLAEAGWTPRERRRRRLHPSARRPCRLEHHAGRRQVGPDLPQRPLPDRPDRTGALEGRARRRAAGDPRRLACSRSSTPAWPSWSSMDHRISPEIRLIPDPRPHARATSA